MALWRCSFIFVIIILLSNFTMQNISRDELSLVNTLKVKFVFTKVTSVADNNTMLYYGQTGLRHMSTDDIYGKKQNKNKTTRSFLWILQTDNREINFVDINCSRLSWAKNQLSITGDIGRYINFGRAGVSVCVCLCTWMCVCVSECVYVCMFIYICVCVCVCVCVL
jgi:hypothetical protein